MKPPIRAAALAAAALLALTGCTISLPDNKGEIVITKPTTTPTQQPTGTPTPPPPAEPAEPVTTPEPAVEDTSAPASSPAPAPELVQAAALSTEAAEVVRLTNLERTNRGLKPYAINTCATDRAQAWSERMARDRWLRHSNVSATMTACQATGASENIASGQRTPAEVVRAWMNSTGHRAAILSTNRTHIGVGVARTSTGRAYWTQIFLKNPLVGNTAPTATPSPTPTDTATATPTATATATPSPTATATTPPASTEQVLRGFVTGYTYADNDPPNSDAIAYEDVRPGTRGAGGVGTYENPVTVAVQTTAKHAPGTIFYLPNLRRYFIVEDACSTSHSAPSGCTSDFDVWIDGRNTPDGGDKCMYAQTGTYNFIKNPRPDYVTNTDFPTVAQDCEQFGDTAVRK
jgi:uncharacterized protein YkwD